MPRKILLADDSVTAQNMGRRILSDAGYEVVTVNNGSAALKKIAEQKPDLVILDVYMPGYGGIELCQRLKDDAETAHIPVLLTVGKLEPFKAEEARKARADAHLIKPFEATELLAMLTRLEQKSAPTPNSRATGKSGKKSDAQASSSAKDRKFGDSESGWKQRLTIPSAKPAEAPEEEPEATPEESTRSTAFRRFGKKENAGPEATADASESVSANVAQDITAEEISAIAAIAASFGEKSQPAESEPSAEAVPAESGIASVEATSATEIQPEAAAPVEYAPSAASESELTAASATATDQEAAQELESYLAEIGAAPEPFIEKESVLVAAEAAVVEPVAPSGLDADLAAALDSLGPANGQASPEASIASTWAVSSTVASRPRWIAEEIALAGDEATFILEREMEKAYAAMAQVAALQAEASRGVSAGWTEIRQYRGNEIPPSAKPDVEAPSADSNLAEVASEKIEVPVAMPEATPSDESAAAVVAETSNSSDITDAIAQSEISSVEAVADVSQRSEAVQEESAYAAAASASPEFRTISHPEPASLPVAAPDENKTPDAPSPAAAEHEAELAAAWAHWRSIRGAVANPQLTDQVASAAAAGYKEMQKAASATEPTNGSTSATPDSNAIASIVDSVLAELKPKLMEEIAKKLAKDK